MMSSGKPTAKDSELLIKLYEIGHSTEMRARFQVLEPQVFHRLPARACLKVKLESFLEFLHSVQFNKPSVVCVTPGVA